MDPTIEAAVRAYRQAYMEGIGHIAFNGPTAFCSYICCLAAMDTLANWGYVDPKDCDRFTSFVVDCYPAAYAAHAPDLWTFRCRMLHNCSPAHFSLLPAVPNVHLQPSPSGDTLLTSDQFYADLLIAANQFFKKLEADHAMQATMLNRLNHATRGGQVWSG